MGLSGSWSRRFRRWFGGRASDATTFGRRASSEGKRLRARAVTRDFKLWEAELSAASTLTTVIGSDVVEVTAHHRPIEEIATHLRRLRSVMDTMDTDVSFVRWEGVIRAYDDYLWAACRELGVPTDLITIGFGRFRDEERARLERVLREVGLPVR